MKKLNSIEVNLLYICSKGKINRSNLTLKSRHLEKSKRNTALNKLLNIKYIEETIIPSDYNGPDKRYYSILKKGQQYLNDLKKDESTSSK